jgi:intracellular multiplication protein IcmL
VTSATDTNPTEVAANLVKLCTILAVSTAVAVLAAVIGIYSAARTNLAVVAATNEGVVIPAVPLDKPYLSEPRIRSFVEECLRRSFSHDFINYRQTVADAQSCYTSDSHFVEALTPKLEEMQKARMVMTNTLPRPPVVIKNYLKGGVYNWELQAELALGLEGTQSKFTPTRFNVSVTVIRVPLTVSVKGALISFIELRPVVGG